MGLTTREKKPVTRATSRLSAVEVSDLYHEGGWGWSGSLDTSFGMGGIVITAFGSGSDPDEYAMALQSDGKIVAAGFPISAQTGLSPSRATGRREKLSLRLQRMLRRRRRRERGVAIRQGADTV